MSGKSLARTRTVDEQQQREAEARRRREEARRAEEARRRADEARAAREARPQPPPQDSWLGNLGAAFDPTPDSGVGSLLSSIPGVMAYAGAPAKRNPPQIVPATEKNPPKNRVFDTRKTAPLEHQNDLDQTLDPNAPPSLKKGPSARHQEDGGRGGMVNKDGVAVGKKVERPGDEDTGRLKSSTQGDVSVGDGTVTVSGNRTDGDSGLGGHFIVTRDGGGGGVNVQHKDVSAKAGVQVLRQKKNTNDKRSSGGAGGTAARMLDGEVITHRQISGETYELGVGAKKLEVGISKSDHRNTQLHIKRTPETDAKIFGTKDPEALKKNNPAEYDRLVEAYAEKRTAKMKSLEDVKLGDGTAKASTTNEDNQSSLDTGEAVTFTEGSDTEVSMGVDFGKVGASGKSSKGRIEQTTIARTDEDTYAVSVTNMDRESYGGSLTTGGGIIGVQGSAAKDDLQQVQFEAKGQKGIAELKRFQKTGLLPNLGKVAAERGSKSYAEFKELETEMANATGARKKELQEKVKAQARIVNHEVMSAKDFHVGQLSNGENGVTYKTNTAQTRKKSGAGIHVAGMDLDLSTTDESTTDVQYVDKDGKKLEARNDRTDWDLWNGTSRTRVVADPRTDDNVAVAVETQRTTDENDQGQMKRLGGERAGKDMQDFIEGKGDNTGSKSTVVVTEDQMDTIAKKTTYDEDFFSDMAPGHTKARLDRFEHEKKTTAFESKKEGYSGHNAAPLTDAEKEMSKVRTEADKALFEKHGCKPGIADEVIAKVKTKEDFEKLPPAVQAYMVRDKAAALASQGKNGWKKTLELAALIEDPEQRARVLRGVAKSANDFGGGQRNASLDLAEQLQDLENQHGMDTRTLTEHVDIELTSKAREEQNAKVDDVIDADGEKGSTEDLIAKQVIESNEQNAPKTVAGTLVSKPSDLWEQISNVWWGGQTDGTRKSKNVVYSLDRISKRKGRKAAVEHVQSMKKRLGPKWEQYKADLAKNHPAGAKQIEEMEKEAHQPQQPRKAS